MLLPNRRPDTLGLAGTRAALRLLCRLSLEADGIEVAEAVNGAGDRARIASGGNAAFCG